MSETNEVSWQSAVATLTAERERAETAARLIKRLGGPGDIASAEITYADGRAESEAVIAALTIALESGKGRDDPAGLDARLERAAAAREALGARATELAAGAKGPALDLAARAAPALLAALGALWKRRGERDAATRTTIAARLEAARWPSFETIAA